MRILRIADVKNNRTGGMSRAIHLTGDEFIRRGHEVHYLFKEDLITSGPAKLRRFTVPLAIPKLVKNRMADVGTFDVVEIHEPLAAVYCFRRRFNRALPPVVVFSHGLEERGYQADLDYRKSKGLPISLKMRISPLSQIKQSKYAVRHADHVLCCNEDDRQYLAARGVPIERLTTHRNGVSDEFLAACAEPSPDRRPGVLFVGTWLLRKGTSEMSYAVSQLMRKFPDFHFTAAGTGVDAAGVKSAFDTELHSRISVIPSVTNDGDLVKLYQDNTIFLLPSFFEGQPLVLIEAAAARQAIVTTPICGMKDFVVEGVNGRFAKVGDGPATAAVLEELWTDPAQCARLGDAARQKAKQFNWVNSADRILLAYEKTLAAGH